MDIRNRGCIRLVRQKQLHRHQLDVASSSCYAAKFNSKERKEYKKEA